MKRIVLASGCFDVLHIGHIDHLRQARGMGHWLVVALTADEAVNKGPGRPLNKWEDREQVLRELRCVNDVIWTRSSVEAIGKVKPQVFVKGIDYAGGDRWTEDVVAACNRVGAKLRFTTTPKNSVTDIIKRTMELA